VTRPITNARRDRDLRLTLRVEVQLAVSSVGHQGHTEDVGASGCSVLVPMRLRTGTRVRLLLLPAGGAGPLSVGATVIWGKAPGGLHGMVFDAVDAGAAAVWFDQLAAGITSVEAEATGAAVR
jgi:hypothetical protein